MLKITCPLCLKELHTGKDRAAFYKHLETKHKLDRVARENVDGETGYKLRKAFASAVMAC